MNPIPSDFSDFTVEAYRELLRTAKQRFRFTNYSEQHQAGKICIWRHDVDFSPQQAFRLAEIEREEDVRAVYFFHLHSIFYNLLEVKVVEEVKSIIANGHYLGLHFDANFYNVTPKDPWVLLVEKEKEILESVFDAPVHALSFHNPDIGFNWMSVDHEQIAGLYNAYGRTLQKAFTYCSDSNGYWRYLRLAEVLSNPDVERLHVLTHPGWWMEKSMSPRQRVQHIIDDRARSTGERYDRALELGERQNVR